MKRFAFFAYGVGCHVLFLAVYVYMAGFLGNYFVPLSVDQPPVDSIGWALTVNLLLIGLFGAQHSIMARPAFKAVWTRLIPKPIERSTYVLLSNLAVILLMWQWRPIDIVVWNAPDGPLWYLLTAGFVVGWLMVPAVSLMINHFDLFGTRQVWLYFRGRPYSPLPFTTPMLYGYVRHPLYVGWALFFWSTPTMTLGHLLFAASLTGYMLLASKVEERDLVAHFGAHYVAYRRQVPAFIPWARRANSTPQLDLPPTL